MPLQDISQRIIFAVKYISSTQAHTHTRIQERIYGEKAHRKMKVFQGDGRSVDDKIVVHIVMHYALHILYKSTKSRFYAEKAAR